MKLSSPRLLSLAAALCTISISSYTTGAKSLSQNIHTVQAKQRAQAKRLSSRGAAYIEPLEPPPWISDLEDEQEVVKRDGAHGLQRRDGSNITFSNPKASEFYVNGSAIPDVGFDAGPSWAGLMPISNNTNETRQLFFWFWPSSDASGADDFIFWTNGGPGCSSLEGFLEENGPISWSWGQAEPTLNPWAWTNLSNVIWVEQPVGTGFTQGDPDISNDDEMAAEVVGFMQQFLEVFAELKGKNFYVTGESYAGYYVPYIANYLYENPDALDLNLKGIWIADPTLSYNVVQEDIPTMEFLQNNHNVIPLNSTFLSQLQNISDNCGYTNYTYTYLTYPPSGLLPLPSGAYQDLTNPYYAGSPTDECALWNMVVDAAEIINPAFDIYRVTDMWPAPWSVLGFPEVTEKFVYFNRTDVQDTIHAPHVDWSECSNIASVYINATDGTPGYDTSVATMLAPGAGTNVTNGSGSNGVLSNVIEKSERVVVVHGLEDFILLAQGTRLAIQNMTWNGAQGFQTPIEDETFIVKDLGVAGNMHMERNLTYVEFYFSGHMTPQFVPWAVYQTIEYLLGRTDSPSAA